jgi:hypothetical protein
MQLQKISRVRPRYVVCNIIHHTVPVASARTEIAADGSGGETPTLETKHDFQRESQEQPKLELTYQITDDKLKWMIRIVSQFA